MAKLTADQRRVLARKAAAARWNTSKTATTSSNKNNNLMTISSVKTATLSSRYWIWELRSWTQNGRYQFLEGSGARVPYVFDTRTGELDQSYDKLTPRAKEDVDKTREMTLER